MIGNAVNANTNKITNINDIIASNIISPIFLKTFFMFKPSIYLVVV